MLVALRSGACLAMLALGGTPATVAAPAPPDANPEQITFSGDWETGDASQWTWTQCAGLNSIQARGTVNVVRQPVGQGSFAARFDLAASDRNNACEVLRERTLSLGSEDWYGLQFRLPATWREPSPHGWGMSIAQFNYQGIWGAPVGLFAHARTIELVLQSGYCNDVFSSNPGCAFSSVPGGNVRKMVVVPRPAARGQWHQVVVHVRWATDLSGTIGVWHRVRGMKKWISRVRRAGVPTVQWSAQRPPGYQMTVDKVGAYRGRSTFPVSVWHDGFVVGTSFEAVAAKLR